MSVLKTLKAIADPAIAEHSQKFFKTGKGEYGEGDQFLGIRVPKVRAVAKTYRDLPLSQLDRLIASPFHEARLCALVILTDQYQKTKDLQERDQLYRFYVDHMHCINNWDLVDVSCHKVVGAHLEDKDRSILYEWAQSNNLWFRRISVISTFWFIRNNDLEDSYRLCYSLMQDPHDLIHKAVGWVLRECGKKDFQRLERYVDEHAHQMPRTMLRYAIEKFPARKRSAILTLTAPA